MHHQLQYAGVETVVLPDQSRITGPQCESAAARALIEDGWAEPEDDLTFLRNGRPGLSGKVYAFASVAVSEASGSPRFVPWRPHPRTELGPLLRRFCEQYGVLPGEEEELEDV